MIERVSGLKYNVDFFAGYSPERINPGDKQHTVDGTNVTVYGKGIHGLSSPTKTLDVGNSGTTLRLMSGLLAAQPFSSRITGDSSIQKRPMGRVAAPLEMMGGKKHAEESAN